MLIQRPWLAGFLKGILPALIIVCCNFLALFMRIDQMSQRLSITTSTLIAAVVFHLNLTASIPPLGYVTYADMFMLINYLWLIMDSRVLPKSSHSLRIHAQYSLSGLPRHGNQHTKFN